MKLNKEIINKILNRPLDTKTLCKILTNNDINNIITFEDKILLLNKLNLYGCDNLFKTNSLNQEEKKYLLLKIAHGKIDMNGVSRFMNRINYEDIIFIYNNRPFEHCESGVSLFYIMKKLNDGDEHFHHFFAKNINNLIKYMEYIIQNDDCYFANDAKFNAVNVFQKYSKFYVEYHRREIFDFSKKSHRRASYCVAMFGEHFTEEENNVLVKKMLSNDRIYDKYLENLKSILKNDKIKMHQQYYNELVSKTMVQILK